jgi:hypothetical protein
VLIAENMLVRQPISGRLLLANHLVAPDVLS